MAVPDCVWPLAAELGEGPVWSAAEGALWFVDIKGRSIHRYHPADPEGRSWHAPSPPGFLAPIAGGGWLAGLKSGLHTFDPATGGFTALAAVEPHLPGNRLNDGCVDRQGRLWFGSMDDAEIDPTGVLYRLDAGGAVAACDAGYVITNGPAFSPDGRTAYHTDTLGRVIYAFDVDAAGGLSGKRLFAQIDRGYPDGPAVDADGCVWTGLFGGWGLQRFAPSGALIGGINFPCANVTKPAFGGEDLKTLYATTAWKGLSPAERAAQPLVGGLFAVRVETPGLPQMEVRLG
ncbi:MAG: SMP-30/gluconolactonase/LRE family protein [Phenylobacterium sp.]|nr:MAG: SMP-30/gluconolactonase/LRE family protein [Phenylobacterium sp.]